MNFFVLLGQPEVKDQVGKQMLLTNNIGYLFHMRVIKPNESDETAVQKGMYFLFQKEIILIELLIIIAS